MAIKKYEISGYNYIEKSVKKGANSGRIYVTTKWIGKKTAVILLDPENCEKDSE